MQVPLDTRVRKIWFFALSLLLATVYMALVAREFVAAHLASHAELRSLQIAVKMEAGNADYHHELGRYLNLISHNPSAAVEEYKASVGINPHAARYWFDLAGTYQLLGDTEAQKRALEHAIQADPSTPDAAWEAANLYLVQGETDKALQEFRVVLEDDPYLPLAALQLCWRVKPDADSLLREVIPLNPGAYSFFLDFLVWKKETAGAAKVWAQLVQFQQPLEARHVFDYVWYLVGQREVDQARLVWQQAAGLCGLSAYQPSAENLVINGDFSLNVLNGGFDWLYHQSKDVSLALDPTQSHTGHRSLAMVFHSRGIEDAGIRQLIPVQPNTTYDFSAYFKAEDIQGAGGPRFAIQDLYSATA